MAKKYKIKKYPGGGEKKEVTPKEKKPVFDTNVWNPNKLEYSKGYEPDPVKWNKFTTWLAQQRDETGKVVAGNPELDKRDKDRSKTFIEQWNKLNPEQKIGVDDIRYAQDWYIRQGKPINEGQKTNTKPASPDLWLGSKTSKIQFPVKQGKYTDYSKAPKDPTAIFNKTIPVVDTMGDIPYSYNVQYNANGTPKVLPGYNKHYGDLPNTQFPEQKNYTGVETRDTINMVNPLDLNKIKNIPSGNIQQFPEGGVKDFFHNFGTGIADIGLSAIGAQDVINKGDYRGPNAETWTNSTDMLGQVSGMVAPMVANTVLPGSGQFVKMGQKAIGGNLNNQFGPQGGKGELLNYPTFAMGGMNTMPNAQVERQEVMQMPNGTTEQVNGPSHKNGGVNVNIPDGTRIFSDRLKSSNKKTFAKEAEQFKTDKEEKILKDVKSDKLKKATAELMLAAKNKNLDKLFQEQESLKMSKVQKYAEKHGIQIPMMANGGQYKYPTGGTTGDNNAWMQWQSQNWDPETEDYNTAFARFNNTSNNSGSFASPQMNKFGMTPINEQDAPFVDANKFRMPSTTSTPQGDTGFKINNQTKDALGYGVGAIAQNLGNLTYLGQQGKKYNTQQEYQYNPSLLSDKEALRQADTEGRVAAQNIASASGGNAGSYLSNRVALGSGLTKAKAGIMEDFANKNAQIKNQGQQFNIQNKYMVDDVNARNKGAALNNYYTALNSVGQGAAGAYKDYNTTQNERKKIGMLPQIYDVYKNNPQLAELLKSWM